MNKFFIVLVSFFCFIEVSGQKIVNRPTDNNTTLIDKNSVKLLPGFLVSATPGSKFRLFIDSNGNGISDVDEVHLPTFSENYIQTKECLDASCSKKRETIVYFDGLGREKQALQVGASPEGKTIGVHYEYDGFGRQVKDYLPTPVSASDSKLIGNLDALTRGYYATNHGSSVAYSEKELENSPLNRILKQAAPGEAWKLGSGHEIKFDYQTNEGIVDKVIVFLAKTTYNSSENIYQAVLSRRSSNETYGFYPTGSLYKTKTTDENGQSIVEFKNKEGQILLKRIDTAEARFDTYYVYDVYGNLTYVLPPKLLDIYYSQNPLRADWLTVMNELGYQYRYDDKNRLVEKKLPGKGWEYMVYDEQDRLVAMQDALLRETGQWLFTKYDQFGRVVVSGFTYENTQTRHGLQAWIKGFRGNNTPRSNEGYMHDGVKIYYEGDTSYGGKNHVLSVTYYDSYPDQQITIPDRVQGQEIVKDNRLKGLPTLSITRNIGSHDFQYNYSFYDTYIRPVRSYHINYMKGSTIVDSQLDFRGKALKVETLHQRDAGSSSLKVVERFTYDDYAERLLTHTHQINDGKEEVLVQNQYDQLGQLKGKKVGNTLNSPLQQIDYRYNIRGWLTDINNIDDQVSNKLFSFRIGYNEKRKYNNDLDKIPVQYNGNISETRWKTQTNSEGNYVYRYDGLNRLVHAFFIDQSKTLLNLFNESIRYDKNGNITNLERNGDTPLSNNVQKIDELTYGYKENSNQLMRVTNTAYAQIGGFIDGNTEGDDYTYDVNGNLTKDLNKGITQIRYNHLNLPTEVLWSSSKKINYSYDASGVKLKKVVTDGTNITSTDYLGGFQYENNVLQFFPTVEGYVDAANERRLGASFEYVYNYTDHLGNIRVSYRADKTGGLSILQENDYYPFGMKHVKMSFQQANILTKNNYKYNGKEFQDEFNINLYDYGARNYDPAIGRWFNVDPLAEQTMEPYLYAGNNPIRYTDPTGMAKEDFVQRGNGSIYWDNNANDQATTKAGETYLGKELSFTFNSYIGGNYDGPLGSLPKGDKLTTTINLSASENSAGELTGLSATKTTKMGKTFGLFEGRGFYPGEGGSNNYFTKSGTSINYEQHASVPSFEETGLNSMGFKIVDVAQKLNIGFDKGSGNLSVNAYTNIFPSATLKLNNTNTTLMNYTQPSFIKTHTAPIRGYSPPAMGEGRTGGQPIRDFSYYPSTFYKRN